MKIVHASLACALAVSACDEQWDRSGEMPSLGGGKEEDDDDDDDDGSADPDPADEDDEAPPTDVQAMIDSYVYSLGTPWLAPADEQVGEPGPAQPQGDYTCSETNFFETKQYDKVIAFAANSHTLFPGAIVGGNSIQTGLFVPKVLPRATPGGSRCSHLRR